MKKIYSLSIILLALLATTKLKAQNSWLFTYGVDTVYSNEFIRVFNKNNKTATKAETQEAMKEYLDLYIKFKKKVAQAKSLGMDTLPEFISEYETYKRQYSQRYFTDTTISQKLVDEAYERLKYELNVSHILINCPADAKPLDTLIAYNKIMKLRERIIKGESFDTVAKYNSEDPSAIFNNGNLGYFTAFNMIYPFETAAYQAKKSEVTLPVRTRFGYHIISLKDKRLSRGRVKVAHIMVRTSEKAKSDEVLRAKAKIDTIYSKIKSGAITWELAALEYSEDDGTKSKGGELNWINSLSNFPEDFREIAFGLKQKGDIGGPVKTNYGWHLIRLIEHEAFPAKDAAMIDKIKTDIAKDERANMGQELVIERLSKQYNASLNEKVLSKFIKQIDSSILLGTYKLLNPDKYNETILTINGKNYPVSDFAQYLEVYQTPRSDKNLEGMIRFMAVNYQKQRVYEYEYDLLSSKFPEFKNTIQEYYEGILLFNISDKRVWSKAIQDTVGLKNFYEANKNNYMWPERLDVSIYECANKDVYKNIKKWLKKSYEDTTMMRMAGEIEQLSLTIRHNKYEKTSLPHQEIKWKKGTYKFEKNNKMYYVVVKEVLPVKVKELREAKGQITSDFQSQLEKQWLDELDKNYPVIINNTEFENLLQ